MGRSSSSSRIERASAEISAAVSDISLTEYNEPDIPTQVFQAGHLNERRWRGSKFELRWAAGVPAGGGSRMEVGRARDRYVDSSNRPSWSGGGTVCWMPRPPWMRA